MDEGSTRKASVVVGVVAMLACIASLVGARNIKPTSFEPLGSAAVPIALGWAGLVLSLALVATSMGRPARATPAAMAQPLVFLGFLALTLLYTAVLQSRFVRYALATSVYLILALIVLGGRQKLFIKSALSAALSFALEYLLVNVLFIDLPTGDA